MLTSKKLIVKQFLYNFILFPSEQRWHNHSLFIFKALGDYSFHQSGFFKTCHDTKYSMDEFFSFRFKIQIYELEADSKEQTLLESLLELQITPSDPA